MRKVILLTFVILTSCRKEPPNTINITDQCWDGTNYKVKYYQVTVVTGISTYAMFLRGKDTLSISQQQTGIWEHTVVLNTRESGCNGIIKIINGQFHDEVWGNCKICVK